MCSVIHHCSKCNIPFKSISLWTDVFHHFYIARGESTIKRYDIAKNYHLWELLRYTLRNEDMEKVRNGCAINWTELSWRLAANRIVASKKWFRRIKSLMSWLWASNRYYNDFHRLSLCERIEWPLKIRRLRRKSSLQSILASGFAIKEQRFLSEFIYNDETVAPSNLSIQLKSQKTLTTNSSVRWFVHRNWEKRNWNERGKIGEGR